MNATFVEILGIVLLAGVVRLWIGGVARLWTIAPRWTHHPIHAAARRRALPH